MMNRRLCLLIIFSIASWGLSIPSGRIIYSIDPDTDENDRILRRRHDGMLLKLVFSDEFEEDGRSFAAGADDIFEAIEKPDDTNQAIQFYNSSKEYVTTKNGSLVLTTRAVKTSWVTGKSLLSGSKVTETKNYTSGMIQTWNKFCFTGGVLELSIELPGTAESGGLWPAAWLMGNLARASWEKTTMHKWPWSYDRCDGGVSDLKTKQEINACDPNPGYGMHPNQGRGAPEIDIFEVMPGHNMPGLPKPVQAFMSNSLQVSPGVDHSKRPVTGHALTSNDTWYRDLYYDPKRSELNYGFWGQECGPVVDTTVNRIHKYQQDAISVNTFLNESHFSSQHIYRLEWQPGSSEGGGYLEWYLDNEFIFGINGDSMAELTGAMIPTEPMYLILNTAVSHRWGFPEPCDIAHCPVCWRCYDCTNPDCQCSLPDGMKGCKNLPAEMKIDYVRLYQDPKNPAHTLGCSPFSHPTKQYIDAHSSDYAQWRPTPDTLVLPVGPTVVGYVLGVVSLGLIGLGAGWHFCRGRSAFIPIPDSNHLLSSGVISSASGSSISSEINSFAYLGTTSGGGFDSSKSGQSESFRSTLATESGIELGSASFRAGYQQVSETER